MTARTMSDLQASARASAERRGHVLGAWEQHGGSSTAECACGAWVTVTPYPMPNGIDIGGPAVAVDHAEAGR